MDVSARVAQWSNQPSAFEFCRGRHLQASSVDFNDFSLVRGMVEDNGGDFFSSHFDNWPFGMDDSSRLDERATP